MARVTFLNAVVSGKVGAGVYAHNKAGSYIRILRKPTNPKSVAQVRARGIFGSASNLWRGCTSAQKSAYNTFAKTLFNPLKGGTGVVYSGQQAANALQIACSASDLLIRATTMKIATVTATNTYGTFGGNVVCPAYRVAGQITSHTGGTLNLALNTASLSTNGTCSMILQADNNMSAAPTFNNVGQTEFIGFGLYMSNPFGPGQSFVTNKFYKFLGSTGPILTCTVTIVTPGTPIEIDFTGTELNVGQQKTWITIGNYVRLTAVAESQTGQLVVLGSYDYKIAAQICVPARPRTTFEIFPLSYNQKQSWPNFFLLLQKKP